MRSPILMLFFLFSASVSVCGGQEVPVLRQTDLPGASVVSTSYYAGQALFGYIDGGAELYLEYRFKKLGRQEIRLHSEKLILEIYQMEGAHEAYGIFSVQRFKCIPVDSLSPNTCRSQYQLQAVLGNCYVSIANESGTTEAQQASLEVFRALRLRIPAQVISFPPLFSNARLKPHLGSVVVAFGPLGVQNGFDAWDSLFQRIPRFSLSLLPIEKGNEHCALANIRFASEAQGLEFCRAAGFVDAQIGLFQMRVEGGIVRGLRRITETEILYGETTASFPERDIYLRMLKR